MAGSVQLITTRAPRTKASISSGREHQRRQVEAAAHDVADPGLAIDGHTRGDEVGDVTIDGALGDLELLGEPRSRRHIAASQQLNDLKQPFGAAHGDAPPSLRKSRYLTLH